MLTLLTLATVFLQTQGSVDFPWAGGFGRGTARKADIVAIVTVVAERRRETRQEVVSSGPGLPPKILDKVVWVRSAAVTAISGKGIRPGESLRIVAPVSAPGDDWAPPDRLSLLRGHRYLLLAYRATDKRLTYPPALQRGQRNDLPGISTSVQLADKTEVAAVMMYPTEEKSVPSQPTDDDVTLGVVKTLDPEADDSYRRVVTSLQYSGPDLLKRGTPGYPGSVQIDYAKVNSATAQLQKQLGQSSPYQRSKIWQLLLVWRVPGSVVGYIRSLQKLADDPSVYIPKSGDEVIQNMDTYHRLENFPEIKPADWLDLVTTARNDAIAQFFLFNYGPFLDASSQRVLAKRLFDSNPQIRILVARQLSLMNRDDKHRPHLADSPAAAESAIQYWINYFKDRS